MMGEGGPIEVKRRRHTPEQIVRKLREADRMLAEGIEVPEVAKALEVSEETYHRAQGRRSPQDAPLPIADTQQRPNRGRAADRVAPAVSLHSPCGLAARDGDPTTLQAPSDHRLSQQVDL